MTNKEQYTKEININKEYKITVKEFKTWLTENNMVTTLKGMLNNPTYDNFDIALDFSIPVAMVKLLRKEAWQASFFIVYFVKFLTISAVIRTESLFSFSTFTEYKSVKFLTIFAPEIVIFLTNKSPSFVYEFVKFLTISALEYVC